MFENIEKEYKKNSKERKFNKFYWISAFISTIVFSPLRNIKYLKYINYGIVFFLVIIYFIYDYKKTINKSTIKKNERIINKFKKYVSITKKDHMNNLIMLLKTNNFKTKNDLKFAIEYYNSKRPIKIESSLLAWITSTSLTLASLVSIAYDPTTQKIDYTKINAILETTIGFVIVALIPILLVKLIIIDNFTFSKEKLHSELSEDLSYIYMNFDKYKNQLNKK